MTNLVCQALKSFSFENRHGFFEIMTSQEREIINKVKPKAIYKTIAFNLNASKEGYIEAMKEIRYELNKNIQEVSFSYGSFFYNILTGNKSDKELALDVMMKVINNVYLDLTDCIKEMELSVGFKAAMRINQFHYDDTSMSEKWHLANVIFPLIGKSTIVAPYGEEEKCNLDIKNCPITPENHAVAFISRGSQPTYHSAPNFLEPRIAVFFVELNVTDFINHNNLAGMCNNQECTEAGL